MDSLLATYDSSDEEEDQCKSSPPAAAEPKSTAKTLFSSLPPPKPSSSSVLFSLPPPKSHLPKPPVIGSHDGYDGEAAPSVPSGKSSLFSALPQPKAPSSLFASLPQPKAYDAGPIHPSPSVVPAKRVVQFRPPPINPQSDDDDDEEEERKRRKNQEAALPSSKMSLLSTMPAPKNSATLGTSSLGSGTSRRSIIDADVPGLKNLSSESIAEAVLDQGSVSLSDGASENYAGYGSDYSNWASGTDENYGDYATYSGDHGDYATYSDDHGNYANYGHYQSNQVEEATASVGPEISGMGGSGAFKAPGKRGRNSMPVEIVEVKQDELMKNRPREDQSKLTGIAFGPSYMPAATKGKPTKLHKRKHQIGSLYFDMKQKEMELAERRAKGMLTKAQTQGKYGW